MFRGPNDKLISIDFIDGEFKCYWGFDESINIIKPKGNDEIMESLKWRLGSPEHRKNISPMAKAMYEMLK